MIALVRHPPLLGAQGLCYGRTDFALANPDVDGARIQAKVETLRTPRIYSSPAWRCRSVAEILAPDCHIDPRLQELAFGLWEGRRWDELPREELDCWAADPFGFAPPAGESGAELVARVRGFAEEMLAGAGDRIVVTHGGPLKILVPLLLGAEIDLCQPAPPPGSVTLIDHDNRDRL